MRQKSGMRKITAFMLTTALMLTLGACSSSAKRAEELMLEIRTRIIAAQRITATAHIRADYGDRAFDFQVKFAGDGTDDVIEIIQPENLKGISAHVKDGGATLVYDGAELDTGLLADGLSPVGIIPMLINEWKTGFTDFTYKEKRYSRGTVTMSSVLPDGSTQKTWFDEKTGLPIRSEVMSSGHAVLVLVYENVIYE